ncbi:DUF1876 domain-containing protein [Streptomyces oceani]|uniref:DUF1876 domain-containing protein n=1 Tax=Streptomyces oceani TaxID=1075402 RepID=A0A1E7JWX6_9ACTN|nr:DUF1876 domain-containing protein [Streptomyces oceani]OEU96170.1 hypothetical protein AN216_21690 [Streptomyces oceani]
MPTASWDVQLEMVNAERVTHCTARLVTGEDEVMLGHGIAHANPADEDVPYIGDELAAARALSDLAHQMLNSAARDIEAHTHQPVRRLRV